MQNRWERDNEKRCTRKRWRHVEVDKKEEVCKHVSQLLFPLDSGVLCMVLTQGCCLHKSWAISYNTGF